MMKFRHPVLALALVSLSGCATAGREVTPSVTRLSASRIEVSVPTGSSASPSEPAMVALCTCAWTTLQDGKPLFRLAGPARLRANRFSIAIDTFASAPSGSHVFVLGSEDLSAAAIRDHTAMFDATSVSAACIANGYGARAN